MNNAQLNTFATELLQRYLKINTVHPGADYAGVIELFRSCARDDGFIHRTVLLPSGFEVLVITYQGTNPDLPSLALHHHMDVVSAGDETMWHASPFAGCIVDGKIIGRGTQDMKGVGVVHYAAIKALKQTGIIPERTMHLIMVPDEERGGFEGMQLFTRTDFFRSLNIGFVFDEGYPSGNDSYLYYKLSERKVVQLKITAHGALAHSSQLMADNALHRLVHFLSSIVQWQSMAQQRSHGVQPGMFTCYNITSLHAAVGSHQVFNMIPNTAMATIDIRVASQQTIGEIIAQLQQLSDQIPAITIEVLAQSHGEEQKESMVEDHSIWYQAVSHVVQQHGLALHPLHFEATTDLRYYQQSGIAGCGFTPFVTTPNLHGINESISIDDLIKGKNIMIDILKLTCCSRETPC